ncbi:uncharacterized protein LOC120014174 [Tripterygium wilfordii]|uniref:uncharacterized protein LOC120014174 n=1 Tax=Tripterygium wilfordii TaxID=458696 RepID=UPI0018F8310D|nr:uncharacterized protein LOC120014174 [Tripterygium wilfordii]
MGIFVGYSTQSKGYRVYNLQTKKILISRDIKVLDKSQDCSVENGDGLVVNTTDESSVKKSKSLAEVSLQLPILVSWIRTSGIGAELLGGHSSLPSPPIFKGVNYDLWAIKMETFFMAHGLWNSVKEGFDPSSLAENPTVQALKDFNEKKQKKFKALTFLHSAIDDTIFTRVVGIKCIKKAWEKLQEEYQGNARVRQQKLLTLKREFELLKMQESEQIKDYSDKLSEMVNQMKLYGEEVPDHKVIEKILISLPNRFEAKIAAIEESCDLTKLSVFELCSKLQAQELRFTRKSEEVTKGAFHMKHKGKQSSSSKECKKPWKGGKGKQISNVANSNESPGKGNFSPCPYCKKKSS